MIEIDEEELDEATREVVTAIEKMADRVCAKIDELIEAENTSTSILVHEIKGITG